MVHVLPVLILLACAANAQVIGIISGADPLIGKEQPALQAEINGPADIAYIKGLLYVRAGAGEQIFRVDLNRNTATLVLPKPDDPDTKDPTLMELPFALAVTPDGRLFFADVGGKLGEVNLAQYNSRVLRKDLLARFPQVHNMTVDVAGRILMTERHSILRWTPSTNNLELIAGSSGFGRPAFSGDEGSATVAKLQWPQGLAVDSRGDIYVSDTENCRIRKIDVSTNTITTVAGDGTCDNSGNGGLAKLAHVNNPRSIVVDAKGNLYFAESCRIRKIDASGVITNYAGANGCMHGDNTPHRDGEPATEASVGASGLAVDEDGNLYFSDYSHNVIRRIDAVTHAITTVAGNGLPKRVDVIL